MEDGDTAIHRTPARLIAGSQDGVRSSQNRVRLEIRPHFDLDGYGGGSHGYRRRSRTHRTGARLLWYRGAVRRLIGREGDVFGGDQALEIHVERLSTRPRGRVVGATSQGRSRRNQAANQERKERPRCWPRQLPENRGAHSTLPERYSMWPRCDHLFFSASRISSRAYVPGLSYPKQPTSARGLSV
jgi:hypothetical protein